MIYIAKMVIEISLSYVYHFIDAQYFVENSSCMQSSFIL